MCKENAPESPNPDDLPEQQGDGAEVEKEQEKSPVHSYEDDRPTFPDQELFNKDPEAWFHKHRPDWDGETVERAVAFIRLGELVETYEKLKNDPTTPQQELERMEAEIRRRRNQLGFS